MYPDSQLIAKALMERWEQCKYVNDKSHYKFKSPQEFGQTKCGNCWDFVEWGYYYLTKNNAKNVRKFYIFTDCDGNIMTHTWLVMDDTSSDRYIYPEYAFGLLEGVHKVTSYENIVKMILQSIAKKTQCELFRYAVFEYTEKHPPYGCDHDTFMEWIADNCPVVEDGTYRFSGDKNKNYSKILEMNINTSTDIICLEVPSEEATPYLKADPELSQYWEQLNRDCYGEVIVDADTRNHIGHVFVWHTKRDKGFIFNLEVKPQYRRQGYGLMLLDDAVKKYGGIDLLVDEDNLPAIALYEKYGFETIKTVNGQLWMKLNDQDSIVQESKLTTDDRNDLPDEMFGLLIYDDDGNLIARKYPLHDKEHVLQAVRFFNRSPDDEDLRKQLARNIVRRAEELGMDWTKWDVLKPYLTQQEKRLNTMIEFGNLLNEQDVIQTEAYAHEDEYYIDTDMSEYIQEATEDVNRDQFRKYVKKLMYDNGSYSKAYGSKSKKADGSCSILLYKKYLKPEFHKYFDRIHAILSQYKESSTAMPTNVKHELFGLLGLSNTKWDIYINRSEIYSDYIELNIYKSAVKENVFDKTGYRFFHQSNIPTLHTTGLIPSNGSTHGRLNDAGERTHNRIYNKPSCFFLAVKTSDTDKFYEYMVKYQKDKEYGKYIYEYKPKSSDVFYEDLFNRSKHQKFGRIMAVPVFINTDKNLPVTRVDKNIQALAVKQKKEDPIFSFSLNLDKSNDYSNARTKMRKVVSDYIDAKDLYQRCKHEIEMKDTDWFKKNGYATQWELNKLEEAKSSNDEKLYSKIRQRILEKAIKDQLLDYKRIALGEYRRAKKYKEDIDKKYADKEKEENELFKRYKAFESFIDNEIENIDIFLEQTSFDLEEPSTEDYIDESSKTRKQIGRTAVAGYAIASGVSLVLLIGSMATGIPLLPGVHTLIEWILFTLLTSSAAGAVTGLLKTIKSNVPEKYAKNVTASICDVLKTMVKKTNEDNNEKTSEITSVKKFRKYNRNLYDELTTWSDPGKMLKRTFDALPDDLKIAHMEMQSMCEYMQHHTEYSKEDVKKYTDAIETLLENIYNINGKSVKESYEDESFTEEEYEAFLEYKIDAAERNKLDDSDFGIPELRKYPLTDKIHVQKAVQMFSHCPDKYKKQLARRILSRAHKFGMDTSKWESLKNHKKD